MAPSKEPQYILVLEDDASISELLDWILSDAGYHVACAESLGEARRHCVESLPDVIIADLLLPDGMGSDFVLEISSTNARETPASIVMSAVPQAQEYAHAAGADICMTKPFDLSELLDVVSSLTNGDHGARHPQRETSEL